VIAPARTGRDKSKSTAVTKIDQIKRGKQSNLRKFDFIFIMVVIKLIAPKIEETPAIWRLKIDKSTE